MQIFQNLFYFLQIDRYLLRCCAQINPQRIIDTPAVNLCSRLVSILSICKKANGKRLFRTDKDVGGSIQKRVCLQTRSPRMYRTYILGRGCPWFYSVAMFLRRKNPSSEHPRTGGILIRSEFCIKLVFSRHTRKYVGKKCTRMYNCSTRLIDKAETVGNGASPFCALIFIFPLDNSYDGKLFHRYH